MPSLQDLQWVVALVAIATGSVALVKVVPPLVRRAGRWTWEPIVAHFRGIHSVIHAMPIMAGEVSQIRRRVEAELGTNGGSSLKDQVTMIAARQAAIFDGMQRPAFQADAHGRFLTVNRAFENLTGYPARDLIGMGWVNLLHQDEVGTFMAAWKDAIEDGRILRRECRVRKFDDEVISVCIDAVPVKVGSKVLEWQGTLEAA